jgi:hypothetical protein
MLSDTTLRLIEKHEQQIAACAVHSIHRYAQLAHLGALPEQELGERGREVFRSLIYWLAHGHEDQLARQYESLGTVRFEAAVPLQESLAGLFLLKYKMLEFIDEQGSDPDYLSLYAEEQFERRAGRFFDLLAIHLVRGYEKAWRHAAHAA